MKYGHPKSLAKSPILHCFSASPAPPSSRPRPRSKLLRPPLLSHPHQSSRPTARLVPPLIIPIRRSCLLPFCTPSFFERPKLRKGDPTQQLYTFPAVLLHLADTPSFSCILHLASRLLVLASFRRLRFPAFVRRLFSLSTFDTRSTLICSPISAHLPPPPPPPPAHTTNRLHRCIALHFAFFPDDACLPTTRPLGAVTRTNLSALRRSPDPRSPLFCTKRLSPSLAATALCLSTLFARLSHCDPIGGFHFV